MKPLLTAFAATLLLLFSPPGLAKPQTAAPEAVVAKPGLWVIRDADTTLYLFGTIHLLDPKYRWLHGPVRAAFDTADELVVETVPPPTEEAQAIVARLMTGPAGSPIATRLPAKAAALYTRALADAGLPADALDRYPPWFAAVTLSLLQYAKSGALVENGADTTLIAAASAGGKPIHPLETFEEQLGLFSTMSDTEQLRFLALTLDELARTPEMIGKLTRAWAEGDVRALTRMMNRGMRDAPALAKRLLDDRNARWAEWIEARLARPGTVFVAVGAGHLGGPASVQALLAKRGVTSRRLQ